MIWLWNMFRVVNHELLILKWNAKQGSWVRAGGGCEEPRSKVQFVLQLFDGTFSIKPEDGDQCSNLTIYTVI